MLVALTIGACILAAAHGITAQLSDAMDTLRRQERQRDDRVNEVRELLDFRGRLEVGAGDSLEFVGLPREARFASWCEVPGGWLERCVVALGLVQRGDTSEVWEQVQSRRPVVVHRGTGPAFFLYLNSAASGGQWFSRWDVELTAPLALGMVVGVDTTIVSLGAGG